MERLLVLRCETAVANVSCASACLHLEKLSIISIRKAVGIGEGLVDEGGIEEVVIWLNQAIKAGRLLGEGIEREKVVHRLSVEGIVRLNTIRKAKIAWRDVDWEAGAEPD